MELFVGGVRMGQTEAQRPPSDPFTTTGLRTKEHETRRASGRGYVILDELTCRAIDTEETKPKRASAVPTQQAQIPLLDTVK